MNAETTHSATLVVTRSVAAPPARVFAAWTDPALLVKWWGPADVVCTEAKIDLRVGGTFRIANQLPNGEVLWISGTYEAIEPPHRLRYTWMVGATTPSIVDVDFAADGDTTTVTVTHRLVPDVAQRADHQRGWIGCLNGLVDFLRSRA